jgi:hypothetical protein
LTVRVLFRAGACSAVLAAALLLPSLAQAAPPIARPNPALVSEHVDYVSPLEGADGGVAVLTPLDPSVTASAIADQAYLKYQLTSDLGGFRPAPLGGSPLGGGGHAVVGQGANQSQIPQFAQAATGAVKSFSFLGTPTTPPDNGRAPVHGLGPPPPVVPPTNTNTVPPPNQGFGGNPPPPTGTTTTGGTTTGPGTTTSPKPPTTTTTSPPPPTTTTTTTTTPPTTTTPTTTGGPGGGTPPPPPPPPPPTCGTVGLSIVSDLANCRIYAINMAPGDSTFEHVTIRNDADEPFTLSLEAGGTQNHLWNDLQMGVWQQATAAPSPLPPLLWWTTQEDDLATLAPGQSITFVIELSLASTAGNDDQGMAAVIDFTWHARA